MWRPQEFVTHPGVGAPRDFVHGYSEAVDATLAPLKYILQAGAQNQVAQHENNQDFIASMNSASTAKRADAYLALEQARQQHYNQSDSARLALEQAQEQRALIQAQAEKENLPLKQALVSAQIAQYKLETQAKQDMLNNQAADAITLSNISKGLHGLSNDDILNGKAEDLFSDVDFKTSEAATKAQTMLHEIVDRGSRGAMVKEQAAWDSSDYFDTFKKLQTDHKDSATGPMIPAISTNEAFAAVQGKFNKDHNKVTQQTQEEQNKQNIDQYSFPNLLSNAKANYGYIEKTADQLLNPDDTTRLQNSRSLASAWKILHDQDPSKDAHYQINPEEALKDAGFKPAIPLTAQQPGTNTPSNGPDGNILNRYYKGTTRAPTTIPLNPGAVQDPSQQPPSFNPSIDQQTIMPGRRASIDDATLNSLGAVHEWRSNQLSALGGADSGQQLASLENAQGNNG